MSQLAALKIALAMYGGSFCIFVIAAITNLSLPIALLMSAYAFACGLYIAVLIYESEDKS